jgi:carbamoyl-phosphate synthase small subunit
VVPATTTAEEALAYKPAGIFLSNGPGDPSALGYAVRAVSDLIKTGTPIFGICLGHQILGQAFGGKTFKLKFGHRGANQPVKDLASGKVEITSQNHGFAVDRNKPIFCVQYHPEASPGPHDSTPLFAEFRQMIEKR